MVHPCEKPCENKTASGYCATTACINPQFSNIGTAQYGQGDQKRIVTNADRLRSMSDEELAEFYGNDVDACPPGRDSGKCIDELYAHGEEPYPSVKQCMECWLGWLLKKHEFGGATGRPRTISFDYHGLFIPSPTITVDSTGDGLITEICFGLDAEEPRTKFDQIRAKSDDEFAEWLSDMAGFLPQHEGKVHSILKLLREEVTDEEEC